MLTPTEILVFTAVIAVGSSVLHEFGHAGFALVAGGRVHRVGVTCWGFFILRSRLRSTELEICCALAGPGVNGVLALLYLCQAPLLHLIGYINGLLFIVNLLPVPKSDGRRIISYLRLLGKACQDMGTESVLSANTQARGQDLLVNPMQSRVRRAGPVFSGVADSQSETVKAA